MTNHFIAPTLESMNHVIEQFKTQAREAELIAESTEDCAMASYYSGTMVATIWCISILQSTFYEQED